MVAVVRRPSPVVECPTCNALVYIMDELCWRCERTFADGMLIALYEKAEYHP